MAYDAFISYSHGADHDLAPVVREGLQRLAKPWNKRRALSVFLDQASLELSSELGGSLDERIEDTRWLVLFMSEQSAQSRWVGAEISEWAEKKSKDQMALVLTSGEIVWDDEAKDFDYERSTAVSEGMRGVYTGQDSEPLFLDMRWTKDVPDGEKSLDLANLKFRDAIATLAAPIHGMPKDELEGEDVRQFKLARRLRRAAVAGLAVLTVTAVVAGVIALFQRAEAIRQRDESEARRLAVVSESHAAEETDLALLLALESLETTDTEEGWGALFTALSQPVLARSPMDAHGRGVNRLLFSPNGEVLASMGGDGTVRLWDPAGERQIGKPLAGHEADTSLWEAAFSPNGSILATPGSDRTVRLWDVGSGAPLDTLEGHEALVWDVAFSPDGELLATASADSTVRLWDLDSGTQTDLEATGARGAGVQVWEVAFSPDGSRLSWVSSDGSVRSRPRPPGSRVEVLLTGHLEWSQGSTAPGVEFSHDGTKLAVASGDRTVQVWDLAADQPTSTTLVGHTGFVVDLAFSEDDARLVSASQDRTVRLWDVASGEPIGAALTGHDAEVFSVALHPGGRLLASGSADRSARLWDLGAGASLGRPSVHGDHVMTLAVSRDGALAATAGLDSKISVWNAATGELVWERPGSHDGMEVNSVAFSPNGALLASAGNDGLVRLWHADSGLPARDPLTGHTDWVRAVRFGPEGKLLASAGDDRTVRLWDPASGDPVGRPLEGHEREVMALAFSSDGKKLASTGWDQTIRLWEIEASHQIGEPLTGQEWVLALRFDPEGTRLWSASSDGQILRWDLASRASTPVAVPESERTAAAFSDDASVLASAAPDGSVRRWDLASGARLGQPLVGHAERVEALGFSRDASLLVSGGAEGTARFWPAQARWRQIACATVGRNLSASEWRQFVSAERPYRRQCAQFGPADAPAPERDS